LQHDFAVAADLVELAFPVHHYHLLVRLFAHICSGFAFCSNIINERYTYPSWLQTIACFRLGTLISSVQASHSPCCCSPYLHRPCCVSYVCSTCSTLMTAKSTVCLPIVPVPQ
jgi:hypothetical protein